ncbi:MAG TPA: hypothetical protein DCL41_03675 [Bdellovibrionales bacterium]|nr:hypothetical protein [Bdellovibrionales bacterium]
MSPIFKLERTQKMNPLIHQRKASRGHPMFQKLSIRTKLLVTFIFVGTTPLLLSNAISYFNAAKEIAEQAHGRAQAVAEHKQSVIESYFNTETNSLIDLSQNPLTLEALKEFSEPFNMEISGNPTENSWYLTYQKELNKYYSEQFGRVYKEQNEEAIDAKNLISKLDLPAMAAQYDFIANNPNPLGEKDKMNAPVRQSPYGESHKKFHPTFHKYLEHHGLYDLFLVNTEGRVVYTVFKETDFATSLTKGPWAGSGLAKAFEKTKTMEAGKIHIEDFDNYTPSYEAAASFISTPLFADGKYQGALIIQLPIAKISELAQSREGLGEKGDTLILGADLRLRADTYRNAKTHTVAASFKKGSKLDFDFEPVRRVQKGEEGFYEGKTYDGIKVLAYYRPVQIEDITWYMIVELNDAEVYAGLHQLSLYATLIVLFGVGGIALAAFLFGGSIARNLQGISDILNQTSIKVSDSSQQSAASATELSESSTEQAASLQETMASIEEISAMVSQNAESAGKTQAAVDTNQKATEEGSQNVSQMITAIGEIKSTNDEIVEQMEASNKEFSEIVKIITEIGEKTKIINDIVFQTKLLSFNASVEASRAGEHGKGFAVVAEEVGNLAQMSGTAAKEITDMLSSSIQKVNNIVETSKQKVDRLVETGREKVEVGNETAQRCQGALDRITENAKLIATMISEISHASKEQAQGIQEINKAIGQLDQAMQQNSTVAQSSSSQAEELARESTQLRQAVDDLVHFINGSGEVKTPKKAAPKKAAAKKNNVIALEKRPKAAPNLAPKKAEAQPLAKAAGSSIDPSFVPSSDDPNFEDF